MISYPIFDYYNTVMIGDPTSLPVIKGSSNFEGGYLIDGNPYFTENLNWISTTVFFRQFRNFVLDMTEVPTDIEISGMHWPTAQATTLQNVVFQMSDVEGNQNQGLFCESGMYPSPKSWRTVSARSAFPVLQAFVSRWLICSSTNRLGWVCR